MGRKITSMYGDMITEKNTSSPVIFFFFSLLKKIFKGKSQEKYFLKIKKKY